MHGQQNIKTHMSEKFVMNRCVVSDYLFLVPSKADHLKQ